jgi:chemotaxis-related protein WspB
MLFLLFQIGDDSYALDAGCVIEVLPLVRWKHIPQAPPGLTGLINYHGALVPLLDLTELALNRPSEHKMTTRIIITSYVEQTGAKHTIGLLAEQVMETLRRDKRDFENSEMSAVGSSYLGPVTTDRGRMIQLIEVDRLFTAGLQDQLFRPLVNSSQ